MLTKFISHENTTSMIDPISTVRELVDAFGGTGRFAHFLNIVPSAVSNMLRDEEIPRGYHLEIYLECQRRRLSLDKYALFGLEADDDKPGRKRNPRRRAVSRARAA
jgi:hypothetical protein